MSFRISLLCFVLLAAVSGAAPPGIGIVRAPLCLTCQAYSVLLALEIEAGRRPSASIVEWFLDRFCPVSDQNNVTLADCDKIRKAYEKGVSIAGFIEYFLAVGNPCASLGCGPVSLPEQLMDYDDNGLLCGCKVCSIFTSENSQVPEPEEFLNALKESMLRVCLDGWPTETEKCIAEVENVMNEIALPSPSEICGSGGICGSPQVT